MRHAETTAPACEWCGYAHASAESEGNPVLFMCDHCGRVSVSKTRRMTSILPTKRYERYSSDAPMSFGESDLANEPIDLVNRRVARDEHRIRLSYTPPAFSLAPEAKFSFPVPPMAPRFSIEPMPVSLSDGDVFVMPNIPHDSGDFYPSFRPTMPAPIEVPLSGVSPTSRMSPTSGVSPTSGGIPSSAVTRPSAKFEVVPIAGAESDSGSLSAIEILPEAARSSARLPSTSLLSQVSTPAPSRANRLALGFAAVAVCSLLGAFFVHRAALGTSAHRNAPAAVAVANAVPPVLDEPFGPPAPPPSTVGARHATVATVQHAAAPTPASSAPSAHSAHGAEAAPAREVGAAPPDLDGMLAAANTARARGDLRGARERFVAIHATSPRFLPAVLGVADTTWELGEQDAARKAYAELAASYPQRLLPARVVERSGLPVAGSQP